MRITTAQWVLQDWNGPTTNVRFRVTANNNFTARDDDGSGVEIDAGSYREVDCTVATAVIEGVTVKTITIPSFWLFSTNDALLPIRTASYRASFVTKNGRDLQQLQLLQNFQLFKELELVFNPVPWHEILRANYPAAPMPMDKETYSVTQILALIGGGAILKGGNAAAPRVTFWSGPITVDGATGFEYQNADPMVKIVQQNATWNVFRVVENAGAANIKVGANPALTSSHIVDETGLWNRAIINDAATRRWSEVVKDGANGLMYSAYDSSNVLIGRTVFDPTGGVAISDSAADFGYFYKASSAYHLGIAASLGIGGASKEITFTTTGVGVNKPTAIGAQLHLVSGAAGRIGFLVDTAGSPSQPIATLRNNTSNRFVFNHDAVATFGLASSVKGKLTLAVANNSNTQTIEGADTPASTITYKLPATDPANGQLLRTNTFSGGVAVLEWVNPSSGGDVSSDIGSVVDNTLTRFNGTTGKTITSSAITVADTTGNFAVPDGWTVASVATTSHAINAAAQLFTAPTSAAVGPVFGFTAAAQTQGVGVTVEVGKFSATYNQTSTAASTHLSLVRTETAVGSGEQNFIKGFSGAAGTTARFRVDNLGNYYFGATGAIIGDGNGNEWLKFTQVASAVNEFTFSNAAAGGRVKLEVTGGDTNPGMELAGKGTGSILIQSAGGLNLLNCGQNISRNDGNVHLSFTNSTAAVTAFFSLDTSSILHFGKLSVADIFTVDVSSSTPQMSITATAPTAAAHAARKDYVDGRKISFSIGFFILDPATANTGVREFGSFIVPNGGTYTFTQGKIMFREGSHTSGGSLTVKIDQAFVGDKSTLTLDNTNNTVATIYTDNFGDFTVSENGIISCYISARSGTITEKYVMAVIEGFRTPF